jgi:hypothetical protein
VYDAVVGCAILSTGRYYRLTVLTMRITLDRICGVQVVYSRLKCGAVKRQAS